MTKNNSLNNTLETTAYAPICGGTTASGPVQAATTGFSNVGYCLVSNGSSALPSWQAVSGSGFTSINAVGYYTPGTYTYTPSPTAVYIIVELVGGGGGGGASYDCTTGQVSVGAPGGGGGFTRNIILVSDLGGSATVTVGAAGAAGVGSGVSGTAGSDTTFIAATTNGIYAYGGGVAASTSPATYVVSNVGVGGGSNFDFGSDPFYAQGSAPQSTYAFYSGGVYYYMPGTGGSSFITGGANSNGIISNSPIDSHGVSINFTNQYGGGGMGGFSGGTGSSAGGYGCYGYAYITEFCTYGNEMANQNSLNNTFDTVPYAPICSGTTSGGRVQAASTGFSNVGYVLTSNGNSALPSWQEPPGSTGIMTINTQTFTSSGTYVPTSGMLYCTIEVVGGGGGGGGAPNSAYCNAGVSGGGGGYARKTVPASQIGSSQTVTIGAGGAGGAAGANSGASGGTTTVTLTSGSIFATGGGGGGSHTSTNSLFVRGVYGGSGSGGDVNATGGSSGFAIGFYTTQSVYTSEGGNSIYGGGGPGNCCYNAVTNSSPGLNATGYGGGGSGATVYSSVSSTAQPGGSGTPGIVIITEYIG